MFNVSLALPVSHLWPPLELAGSKGGHFLNPHAVTAEPCRVSPPEAVVYLGLISFVLFKTTFFRSDVRILTTIESIAYSNYSPYKFYPKQIDFILSATISLAFPDSKLPRS